MPCLGEGEGEGEGAGGARRAGALAPEQKALLAAVVRVIDVKLSDGGRVAHEEYAALECASAGELAADARRGRFAVALAMMGRNRYGNVLPYDDHRVRLLRPPPPSPAEREAAGAAAPGAFDPGYVNASPLEARTPGDVAWGLIATQAPLRQTREQFWCMVLEARASAIVQLTNYNEGGVVKATPYHAPDVGWKKLYGDVTVKTLTAEASGPALTRCDLVVRGAERVGGRAAPVAPLRVRHWHYDAWPDHGVPTDPGALLLLVQALLPASDAPVVVHCSAGIGRSGVFAAVLVAARRLEAALAGRRDSDPLELADLARIVADLRAQRAGCVQTAEQYRFAYCALREWAREREERPTVLNGPPGRAAPNAPASTVPGG